jgi:alpha-L-rhamnosidase
MLHIAVLGYANVQVNGCALDNVELLGDWTNYTKLVTYRSFDVTGLVHQGENEIMIELGNGWYNPSPLLFLANTTCVSASPKLVHRLYLSRLW